MNNSELSLMAHLMRRAGFGASRDELETRLSTGYEATVDELLNPIEAEAVDIYELLRYHHMQWKPGTLGGLGQSSWVWRMINTKAPLEEKMCLFWHHIFATGVSKVDHYDEIIDMIDMFREKGLGKFRDLLIEVAKSPAMLYWLDNNENHAEAVNENWGRELLELFTLGVGNYTETDVREASRAFTGWTMTPKLPRFHMGRWDWYFEYRPDDHDNGEKTFLGHTGNLNGEDIIDIILEQPATARFIARHLYSFFVADEVQVPAWEVTPPKDADAVNTLADVLMTTDYDIRATLLVLFNSDFFKAARFSKIKSPAEVVVSTLRLMGDAELPSPKLFEWSNQIMYMGQDLLNPPSVEGWHTGVEWINSGSLMKRTNFLAEMVSEAHHPGIRSIIDYVKSEATTPDALVDRCLDILGPIEVADSTRAELLAHAASEGDLVLDDKDSPESARRIAEMLQLIMSTKEYMFA
ncbi:MAG: DUF1800 domain-containing protein [Chloroflexi bacterium]|nr:DUF1800 domain-containing protein [Chloroflexota bacterium]